jgi:hypothetical protein
MVTQAKDNQFLNGIPSLLLFAIFIWLGYQGLTLEFGKVHPSADTHNIALAAGLFALMLIWFLGSCFSGDWLPWAIARKPTPEDLGISNSPVQNGLTIHNQSVRPVTSNQSVSLSKLQTLLYFSTTVFAYVLVFTDHFYQTGSATPLPRIPVELLALIGLSAATTLGSQAISVQYQAEKRTSDVDRSDILRNRDGQPDLTKVQMLVWTIIGITIYGISLANLVHQNCLIENNKTLEECKTAWGLSGGISAPTLPTFDSMLLVLAGVVQGSYIAGRLVVTRAPPQIDGVYCLTDAGQTITRIVGVFSGINSILDEATHVEVYNLMLEITDSKLARTLVNLGDLKSIDSTKAKPELNSTVKTVTANSSLITLENLMPSGGEYSFRVSIDGIWSQPKLFKI